jgi:hypothetical protein
MPAAQRKTARAKQTPKRDRPGIGFSGQRNADLQTL